MRISDWSSDVCSSDLSATTATEPKDAIAAPSRSSTWSTPQRSYHMVTHPAAAMPRRIFASAIAKIEAISARRGEHEDGRAEAALGRHPADVPLGPAATGAAVGPPRTVSNDIAERKDVGRGKS